MANKQQTHSTMNIILWVTQVILAASFTWAAAMKLFQSHEKLAVMWPWTADNIALVKITGLFDLVAAIGLVLPAALRIQPKLTVYAAYGTIALMVAASAFHIARGEASSTGINILFATLAVFIAWGRLRKAPIKANGRG